MTGWDARIARAAQLELEYAFAAEILRFYREILLFQRDLQARGGEIDAEGLADLVRRAGPAGLAGVDVGEARRWPEAYAKGESLSPAEAFYARVFLEVGPVPGRLRTGNNACPACGHKPQVGVLRPEGHGARRSLVCHLCAAEWEFPRACCVACGETVFDKLAVYTAEQFAHVRVEACDSCQRYIKTVDLTKNGLAVPVVDELATTPLDLWARERGYLCVQPNLLAL